MRAHLLIAIMLGAGWTTAAAPAWAGDAPVAAQDVARVRAVYHFDAGLEQARRGLRNIRNHLVADPAAQIAVVGLGDGIDFMLKGAKTDGGYPFQLIVEELQADGVKFKVCNNTLIARHIEREQVLDDIEIVTSGVAELARLQSRERYAYIKP
ncbi:DsrE family protein [Fontimonas sp. SYSU GA230001]|uniref:DsrE family protein n=1 Tax=Fontimonas sp. SYSU GA230001 TaxID=3142450 RepID=UPI0032B39D6D